MGAHQDSQSLTKIAIVLLILSSLLQSSSAECELEYKLHAWFSIRGNPISELTESGMSDVCLATIEDIISPGCKAMINTNLQFGEAPPHFFTQGTYPYVNVTCNIGMDQAAYTALYNIFSPLGFPEDKWAPTFLGTEYTDIPGNTGTLVEVLGSDFDTLSQLQALGQGDPSGWDDIIMYYPTNLDTNIDGTLPWFNFNLGEYTGEPTSSPITESPTLSPSTTTTASPSVSPTKSTGDPTKDPTMEPTMEPCDDWEISFTFTLSNYEITTTTKRKIADSCLLAFASALIPWVNTLDEWYVETDEGVCVEVDFHLTPNGNGGGVYCNYVFNDKLYEDFFASGGYDTDSFKTDLLSELNGLPDGNRIDGTISDVIMGAPLQLSPPTTTVISTTEANIASLMKGKSSYQWGIYLMVMIMNMYQFVF